jgi:DNA-binding PadR family transcriptional regulator
VVRQAAPYDDDAAADRSRPHKPSASHYYYDVVETFLVDPRMSLRRERFMPQPPGDFEKIILFALLRLGEGAYGVPIRREIVERTGREISIGAVYTALHRLEKRGYVASQMGEPTPERGGRRKKLYTLLPAGARALSEAYDALRRMAEGIRPALQALAEVPDA